MHFMDSASDLPKQEVVFEDYLFYAAFQRQEEEVIGRQVSSAGSTDTLREMETKSWFSGIVADTKAYPAELPPMTEDEIERANASRAMRITSWASVFYLISTDILGPSYVPYAIAQLGWVPGIILCFIMAVFACYAGLLLWTLFLRLDSLRYPLKTYGDVAERIFGKAARHICTFFQTLQLVVLVAVLCLTNGQALSQMSKGRVCFSVCIIIFPIIGIVIGQMRTLNGYSILSNLALWFNLAVVFIVMGFVAHSPPNFGAALTSLGISPGPVVTQTFVSSPLFNKVNAMLNIALVYGGAMLFIEIMAEMRRPMDFWKGLVLAQIVVFITYVLFGCFIYGFQGQFTLPLAYQGVSIYAWQTVGNAMSLVTGVIAAALFSHVSTKIIYISFIEDLGGPSLMSSKGTVVWAILVICYWALAYIIAAAIPQVQTIHGLIAAVAIVQFSYTFPPLLMLGYNVITDAAGEDRPHIPGSGAKGRIDTWRDWSRWKRGLFGGPWYRKLFKLFNLFLGLACLSAACLGIWAAGEAIKATFAIAGGATSFGCKAPV